MYRVADEFSACLAANVSVGRCSHHSDQSTAPVEIVAIVIAMARRVKLPEDCASTSFCVRRLMDLWACRTAAQKIMMAIPRNIVATSFATQVGSVAPKTALRPMAMPTAPNPVPIQLENVRSVAKSVRSSAHLVRSRALSSELSVTFRCPSL